MNKLVNLAKKRRRWPLKIQREYDNIDGRATQIMLKAEKTVYKHFSITRLVAYHF